jgi:hypothetical protein
MSQATLQTTPLFRTSLRSWQASYKASQTEGGPGEGAPSATAQASARGSRFGLRKRRARRGDAPTR